MSEWMCVCLGLKACKATMMKSLRLGLTRISLPERRRKMAPSNRAVESAKLRAGLNAQQGTERAAMPSVLCLKAGIVMSTITDNMEDILMDDSKITMVTGVDHIR